MRSPCIFIAQFLAPNFKPPRKKKVSLLSGDNESKRSRPQKIVQVGPKRRCSQFEHHAWLFCRETKWKTLQTQVQNPASVRDSLKPRISPDHFQLVNLTLRGAPVSEPIRDVYKCYQHLHIITYSSTSASNSVANMRGCFLGLVLACRDACYWRLCPLAEWLMRKWSAEIRKQGYFRRKTLQSFELCLTFWSLNRDPSVGKTENTQKVQRHRLPETLIAEIQPVRVDFYAVTSSLVVSPLFTIWICTQRACVWSLVRFWFAITLARACSISSRICFPANSTGLWLGGFVFASGPSLHRAKEGLCWLSGAFGNHFFFDNLNLCGF